MATSRLRAEDPSADVLAPKLTKWDQRVLRAVPEWPADWWRDRAAERERLTVWGIAERMGELNVQAVWETLRALLDLGYVHYNHRWKPTHTLWWREGDRESQ